MARCSPTRFTGHPLRDPPLLPLYADLSVVPFNPRDPFPPRLDLASAEFQFAAQLSGHLASVARNDGKNPRTRGRLGREHFREAQIVVPELSTGKLNRKVSTAVNVMFDNVRDRLWDFVQERISGMFGPVRTRSETDQLSASVA